ncbi:MAG: ice-binding family protein [Firmicutes bacterium]|nr:ice-binding family protein [Bacillota bacterium]
MTNAKWVSNLAMTAYSGAIDSAQTVADIAVATQIQIDDGLSVLSLATSTFNAEKENGTKAEVVHAIDLGTSANYAALAKSGISTTGATSITGNVAISPAAGTYLTGFSETLDATNTFSTSSYVTGHLFAYDYASPTPVVLGTATADMQIAYNTGAGILPDYTELFAGDLSGKTMSSGAYQWSNNLLINTDLTLTGNSTDIWVFQIAGTLTQAAGVRVTLAGGALPENIYWIVGDSISMGVGAHTEGTMLGMTNIAMQTNSSINGRLLAQTAITLDSTTVVKPN